MGYRSVVITSAANLTVKKGQLIITGDGVQGSLPVEDIRTLMIENRLASVTAYALSHLSQEGVTVYFCDEKHLPCAFLQSYAANSRRKKQLELQLSQTKPRQKQLWKTVVEAKIANQIFCLRECGVDEAYWSKLSVLQKQVLSGDSTNVEARAAALYFRYLFGKSFARSEDNDINSHLNYGYAIVRGYLARLLADYGYEPCWGIHHESELNAFNLADDLIEPFRPLVDLFVFQNRLGETFDSQAKREMANILNYEVLVGKEHHSAAYAAEKVVQSLGRCFQNKDEILVLPCLHQLKRHEYE